MRPRLIMTCHSLLTSKKLLTHVAAEHIIMRWCVAMLLHCFLTAELPIAFAAHVSMAEGCIVGARVVLQPVI